MFLLLIILKLFLCVESAWEMDISLWKEKAFLIAKV